MKRLVLDQMHSPSLTPKVTSFYLHELFILASSFTTSVPCTLFFSFPHVLSLRHPVSPLCHRVVGDTGAAGENPSYLQQQLLWPLWVSIEGAETKNNFLFIKKKIVRNALHNFLEPKLTSLFASFVQNSKTFYLLL